jgi:hypothetical protein
MKEKIGPLDFRERDQRLAAIAYLDTLKALEPLRRGDVGAFLDAASQSAGWASLPPHGTQQQAGMTKEKARVLYEQFLRQRQGR